MSKEIKAVAIFVIELRLFEGINKGVSAGADPGFSMGVINLDSCG